MNRSYIVLVHPQFAHHEATNSHLFHLHAQFPLYCSAVQFSLQDQVANHEHDVVDEHQHQQQVYHVGDRHNRKIVHVFLGKIGQSNIYQQFECLTRVQRQP